MCRINEATVILLVLCLGVAFCETRFSRASSLHAAETLQPPYHTLNKTDAYEVREYEEGKEEVIISFLEYSLSLRMTVLSDLLLVALQAIG